MKIRNDVVKTIINFVYITMIFIIGCGTGLNFNQLLFGSSLLIIEDTFYFYQVVLCALAIFLACNKLIKISISIYTFRDNLIHGIFLGFVILPYLPRLTGINTLSGVVKSLFLPLLPLIITIYLLAFGLRRFLEGTKNEV